MNLLLCVKLIKPFRYQKSPNQFVTLKENTCHLSNRCVFTCGRVQMKGGQTKSVKSSTVDTSLFLCPVASVAAAAAAEVLCCIDLLC